MCELELEELQRIKDLAAVGIETWRPVVGYEGMYSISSLGNVRSEDRVTIQSNGKHYKLKGKIIKPYLTKKYYRATLWKDKKPVKWQVSILVACSFLGHTHVRDNKGRTIVVDHINENRLDNNINNLQIITQSKNVFRSNVGVSGLEGIAYRKSKNTYYFTFKRDGKLFRSTSYKCKYEAQRAREQYIIDNNIII